MMTTYKNISIDLAHGNLVADGHDVVIKKDDNINPIVDKLERNPDGTLNLEIRVLVKKNATEFCHGKFVIPRFEGTITVTSDGYKAGEHPYVKASDEKELYTIYFEDDEDTDR